MEVAAPGVRALIVAPNVVLKSGISRGAVVVTGRWRGSRRVVQGGEMVPANGSGGTVWWGVVVLRGKACKGRRTGRAVRWARSEENVRATAV